MTADRSVLVKLRADISDFQRKFATAGTTTSVFVKQLDAADGSINQLTGRLRVLAEVGAILGPTFVPIGAVAIPAVTGLAAQLSFAAVAGGVLMGSLRGLGGALDAMNKAQLEPTTENIAKAEDALNALAPAVREFAEEVRGLAPTLKAIRDIGAEALVPGLTESLDDLERLGPKVAAIFDSVGGAMGEIAADGAASLASERWAGFFEFIAAEAPQALSELASTIGSITHGMAEMWQAFTPLNDGFSSWLMDAAADFDTFATGLSKTQGFAEFVDYIQTSGPQVADTLGAIGNMFLQIVQAAAPLGGPILGALESVADVVANIADSDLGAPILAGVAALSLLNRSLAVTAALSKTSLSTGIFAGASTLGAGMKKGAGSIRSDIGAMSDSMVAFGANTAKAGAAADRMKGRVANLAKGGAALGGLAVVASGAADGIGLTNTASLALMGTLGGPPGIAIGAAAGALLDLKAAGNEAHDAMVALNAAVDTGNLDEITAAIERQKQALADYRDTDFTSPGDILETIGTDIADTFRGDFTGTEEKQEKALAAAERATEKLHAAEKAREADAKMAALTYARSVGVNMDIKQSALSTVKEIEAQAAAMLKAREAAQGLADSFGGLGASLNDSERSFGQWLAEMEAGTRALANFNSNSIKAARKGLDEGLIVSLRNAGKEGALRMEQLANGTEGGVKRANRAFRELQAETERTRRVTERLSGMVIDIRTDKARDSIAALEARLNAISDEDVYINVRHNPIGSPDSGFGPQNSSARGNIFSNTRAFARGDIANGHQAELAGPGVTRMWREPETQGEAYIPLANDSRRPRAQGILEETAGILGGTVEWFARGGTAGEKEDAAAKKAKDAREDARQRAEERRQREEEKRQRQLDKQATKAQLKSDLDNQGEQARLAVQDARRRLQSAREADRPKSELLDLRLGLKQARGTRDSQQADQRTEREEGKLRDILDRQEKAAEIALLAAEDQLDAAEKNQETAKADLEVTKQLRDSLASTVKGQFSNSLTGGGFAGLDRTLSKDIAGGSAMASALQALVDAGLDTTGPAAGLFQELASSNDVTTANQLLAGGPDAISYYEQQFAGRASINDARGEFVAEASYGQMIAAQTQTLAVAQQAAAVAEAAAVRMQGQLDQANQNLQNVQATVAQQSQRIGEVLNGVMAAGFKAGKNK